MELSTIILFVQQERNATSIYKARSVLLGLGDEHVKATIPENYNIQAVDSGLAAELGIGKIFVPCMTVPYVSHWFGLKALDMSETCGVETNIKLWCI